MAKYLDENGVRTLWSKIKNKLAEKPNKTEVYTKSDLTFVLNGTTLTITKK